MEIKGTEIIFNRGAGIILRTIFILLLTASVIFSGCALQKKNGKDSASNIKTPEATAKPSEPRTITEIKTEEDAKSIRILVKGNRLLTYTSVKQPFPLAILLYFSDTELKDHAGQDKSYNPEITENNIISSVKTSEISEDKKPQKASRIEISLKKDIPYEVIREDTILKISFEKEEKPAAQENKTAQESKIEEHDLTGISVHQRLPKFSISTA